MLTHTETFPNKSVNFALDKNSDLLKATVVKNGDTIVRKFSADEQGRKDAHSWAETQLGETLVDTAKWLFSETVDQLVEMVDGDPTNDAFEMNITDAPIFKQFADDLHAIRGFIDEVRGFFK